MKGCKLIMIFLYYWFWRRKNLHYIFSANIHDMTCSFNNEEIFKKKMQCMLIWRAVEVLKCIFHWKQKSTKIFYFVPVNPCMSQRGLKQKIFDILMICLNKCAFFRPFSGPESTWSVQGLSLVNPPAPPPPFRTWTCELELVDLPSMEP